MPIHQLLFTVADDRKRRHDIRRSQPGLHLPGNFKFGLCLWAALTVVALGLMGRMLAVSRRSTNGLHVHIAIVSSMLLFSLFLQLGAIPRQRRKHALALVAECRCGVCGYDLAHANPEADGCRVCPECGARGGCGCRDWAAFIGVTQVEAGDFRPVSFEERTLIEALLSRSNLIARLRASLDGLEVAPMNDGGMGSLKLRPQGLRSDRRFGRELASAEFNDADGVVVSVALNVDSEGELFELDLWKVNFAPLIRWPRPSDLG